jgi:hypothetical protein
VILLHQALDDPYSRSSPSDAQLELKIVSRCG